MTPIELMEILAPDKAYILETMDRDEIYLTLAEESVELAKACLKMHRAMTEKSPTPISERQAHAEVEEELGDVWLCCHILELAPNDKEVAYKVNRWTRRLLEKQRNDIIEKGM